MEDLFIYSGFALVGMLREFSYLKWIRRYNRHGEFIFETLATPETRRLIAYADSSEPAILYKGYGGEAAFIEDFTASRDALGHEIIEATGRFLSSILERRIFTLNMTGTLKAIIDAIITQNFTNPLDASRKIPEMRLVDFTPSVNPSISVDYKNANALEVISELCGEHGIGFETLFRPAEQKYDFVLYEGRPTYVLLTDGYFNISEQDYYFRTSQEKTTCFVDNNGAVTTVGGDKTGLARREMYIQADAQSASSAQTQGESALFAAKRTVSFDTIVNIAALQFEYKTDWDLGDVVTCESRTWNKSITQNVLEVTEYYDKGGVHLTPVFGDYIQTGAGAGSSGGK